MQKTKPEFLTGMVLCDLRFRVDAPDENADDQRDVIQGLERIGYDQRILQINDTIEQGKQEVRWKIDQKTREQSGETELNKRLRTASLRPEKQYACDDHTNCVDFCIQNRIHVTLAPIVPIILIFLHYKGKSVTKSVTN